VCDPPHWLPRSGNDRDDATARAGLLAAGAAGAPGGSKARGTLEVELYGGAGGPDDEDEDMLLDWELHNPRRWQLFGVDCSWAMRCVPERFHAPPEWCAWEGGRRVRTGAGSGPGRGQEEREAGTQPRPR
jgi:hypothetical protein